MFSSLASFLFGSNTNCETNSKSTTTATGELNGQSEKNTCINLIDNDDNLIKLTSLTPSVTGATAGEKAQGGAIKRGKNSRNNARQQNKRKGIKAPLGLSTKQAKVLSPNYSADEEDTSIDEDEWFIVEKEEEKRKVSPTRNDSEEENLPIEEVIKANKLVKSIADNTESQQRHQQHINLHSLYSGPRPQKQRNFLQKTRNNNKSNRLSNGLSVSTLSPSRTVNDGCHSKHEALADAGVTRSMFVALPLPSPIISENEGKASAVITATKGLDVVTNMEESWFVTPPPCFTSVGPINMETSPYENLLIEHPSMSVYHSIKMAEEATDGLTKLDIGVQADIGDQAKKAKTKETNPKKNSQAVQSRNTSSIYRLDRQTVAQLKQELLARNVQKVQLKHDRQNKCRSALKRTNKSRDVQSRNHIQRRSDLQCSKHCSNANNNRKSNRY